MKSFIKTGFILCQVIAMISGQKEDENDSFCYSCQCYDTTIDCMHRGLENMPKGSIEATTTNLIMMSNALKKIEAFDPGLSIRNISFQHNLISVIQEQAFINLVNLTHLDLSHNLLTSQVLKPIMFIGPPSSVANNVLHLKVLKLGSNSIHTVHQDLFEFLPDLEELDLSSNPLKVLDHGTMTAFSSLHFLKRLDLSSTQLSRLPRGWLNALKDLEVLNLASNSLTKLFSLEETRSLRHLILDGNPIEIIKSFPTLPSLKRLDLNWMPRLTAIKAHSLINLTAVTELSIANNHYLVEISEDALVEPGNDTADSESLQGSIFPPLEKLDLSDNRLGYLEEHLFDRWDNLKELKLDSNPWICDCKNQWMVTRLVRIIHEKDPSENGGASKLICGEPIEMKGESMLKLHMEGYEMRCLDYYGNQPDKDAKVLIFVLIAVLIAIPVSLLFLHLVKKPRQSGYPTAYYRRARSFESIN